MILACWACFLALGAGRRKERWRIGGVEAVWMVREGRGRDGNDGIGDVTFDCRPRYDLMKNRFEVHIHSSSQRTCHKRLEAKTLLLVQFSSLCWHGASIHEFTNLADMKREEGGFQKRYDDLGLED